MKYNIPKRYYFRLHHVRPRFKGNLEEVLLYVASAITEIGKKDKETFKNSLLSRIYKFPGNVTKKKKTIQNWRTEISAIFALYYDDANYSYPGDLAVDLYQNQDLTKFFKYFVHSFQYPGGHIKHHEVSLMLEKNILFHPASFFALVLIYLSKKYGSKEAYITKAEATHCCFNDIRALNRTFDYRDVAKLIIMNRRNKMKYDWSGDVIRYAGDMLDYMLYANLLKSYQGRYYLNRNEKKAILRLIKEKRRFIYSHPDDMADIAQKETEWFKYVNSFIKENIYETDVLAFIAKDEKDYTQLVKRTEYIRKVSLPESGAKTKDIGDYGENIIYGHECMYLKNGSRSDLIKLVKCIPNYLAVGYDIQSVRLDETKKYIEVKTTISNKSIVFNKFHLTSNELGTAQTLKDNYYVYRLQLSRGGMVLYVLRDPINLFKRNKIKIDLKSGEINLDKYRGERIPILKWAE